MMLELSNCACYAHNGFLTAKGRQAADRMREQRAVREAGLTRLHIPVILDRYGSVSALAEAEASPLTWVDQELLSEGDPHGS